MVAFAFAPPPAAPEAERVRGEIREFLASELRGRSARARAGSWGSRDPAFSRKMGARGWIGMTWPKRYGGRERSALERYVVLEEVLAAGAPMGAHWIADRQSGPLLLRFGTEEQRQAILPRIAAGECYFCIGMSEPDSGSDLAATRTRAVAVQGGFLVNGTKIWTSNAHQCHYVILFCRTELATGTDRHAGMSQFLVDLSLPGITIRPIRDLAGEHHFNEVVFEDVFLPANTLIGELGAGWRQVTSELAYERSGPERFLSTYVLLVELLRALGSQPSERAAIAAGRLTGHIIILRRLSRSVAGMLQAGEDPALQAALVKDLGTTLEQEIPEVARLLIESGSTPRDSYDAVLAHAIMRAPSFSIRGGTREILRGIVARGLGVR
jgi:alkylation response protein AidB-like acyl-CoA dehydrogenase